MAEYISIHKEDPDEARLYELIPMIQYAIERGALCQAWWELRRVLETAPMSKTGLLLLDRLLAEIGGDSEGIFRLCGKKHTQIDVALHAYALGAAGQYNKALYLLCELARLDPTRPLLAWAWRWLPPQPTLQPETLYPPLYHAIQICRAQEADASAFWLQLLALSKLIHQSDPTALLWLYLRAEAAREIGDLLLAQTLALELRSYGWTAESFVLQARNCEAEAHLEEATQHYQAALRSHLHHPDIYAEIIAYLLQRDRWEEAQQHLRQLLHEHPYHPHALALFFWASYRQTPSGEWSQKLTCLARAYPHDPTIQHIQDHLLT